MKKSAIDVIFTIKREKQSFYGDVFVAFKNAKKMQLQNVDMVLSIGFLSNSNSRRNNNFTPKHNI